ncbi:MAG: FtsX-like permease family protein [Dehalococcoidia bacterium]|nr:FtsX-like permease family protein [Dehalococcoidia bacterium]
MTELFGIPLTSIMIGLLILLAAALAVIGVIAARHPLLVRMGLRNLVRRPAQTVLIVVGLMLATLIMSAAFATGDTVGYSVTNSVYRSLAEIDFILGFKTEGTAVAREDAYLTADVLTALEARFRDDADFDAFAGVVRKTLPVVNTSRRLSEPRARMIGADAAFDRFRTLRDASGREVSVTALGATGVYLTESLADAVAARAGDRITVFVENQPTELAVVGVVRNTDSIEAFADDQPIEQGGGLILPLALAQQLTGHEGRFTDIVVSSRGGVRDALALREPRVEDKLDAFIEEHPEARADVTLTKEQLVGVGELIGSVFVTFFIVFGLFSIAAGVMLIFLIFVMLAAERRSEMGMARAIGMSRLHLTETFLAEGMAYNLGSAAVGGLLGLGVAALLVFVMGQLFDDFGLSIAFHFNPRAFVIAYSLGVVLTFATVLFAAYRAANLNIVRAIRDLPEPRPLRAADRSAGTLLRTFLAVPWTLAWILLVILWVVVGFIAFVYGIKLYGLGIVGVGLLATWFVFGALQINNGARSRSDWAWYIGWWITFSVLALLTWSLLRTRKLAQRYRNAGGWALWMLLGGVALAWTGGWVTGWLFAYASGTTLAVLAIAMLAVYYGTAPRAAFTVAGLALVWWWLLPLPFSLFIDVGTQFDPVDGIARLLGLPRADVDGNIEMFFVSGISITAAATLTIIFNAEALLGVLRLFGRALGGIAPAVRTAVAYPLAAKFRTGMTLAMFGLVTFSLVVMSTLNSNFTQLFAGNDARAGFDVLVEANPANRVPDLRAALQQRGYAGPEIGGVGTVLVVAQVSAEARENGAPAAEFGQQRMIGVDDEFLRLARMPLQYRARGYADDAAVIAALRSDPSAAAVDASTLAVSGGFGPVGDRFALSRTATSAIRDGAFEPVAVSVRNPRGGQELQLQIIGVFAAQTTGVLTQLAGLHISRANVERVFAGGDSELFLVTTADGGRGADVRLAQGIESALLEQGVQATAVRELIDRQAQVSNAFSYLFEGFMGLGLIVGIAALGVIAFRTVVERRQQIGMLRAIGYTRRLIALSFFMESSFICITGVAMGVLLGIALSYNLLTSGEVADGQVIAFSVPWGRILLVAGVAYGASALMTLIPARAASRVSVAEALRYE